MYLLGVLASFFIGSIPFGYIIVKNRLGVDITKEGSGNIGSTNVGRVVGKKYSIIVQILDILKGLIPVLTSVLLFDDFNISLSCLIAVSTVIGHIFSPFMSFKGGKGVNTTLGAFFLLCPLPVIVSVIIHILLKFKIKPVSIRSIILAIIIPVASIILNYDISIIVSSSIVGIIVIFAHRENIYRIINKKEL